MLPCAAALVVGGVVRLLFAVKPAEEPVLATVVLSAAYVSALAAAVLCTPLGRRYLVESVTTFTSWRQ
jgi:hypothetical protein